MVRYKTRTVTKYRTRSAPKRAARRRGRGGGKLSLLHLGLAAGGLAYLTSQGTGPKFVTENIAKIPGAKTFGGTAVAGIACLAVDRYVKPNKWLRLAGYAGVIAAAMQVGKAGSSFKWVGDDGDDVADVDLGDDDDVGSLDP
jgi:hypothetical protein